MHRTSAISALVALLSCAGCQSTSGVPFGATLQGYVSTRSVSPFPAVPTFAIMEGNALPTIEDATINECLQHHMESLGSKRVGLGENPRAVVGYRFETGSAPTGYRNTSMDGSYAAAVWNRKLTVYLFDGEEGDRPKSLWMAEISSKGPVTSAGPLSYTFFDQAFQRFARSVSNEAFMVLAKTRCAAVGAAPR